MLRVNRILCIVRGADSSGELRRGALLARAFGAELHVVWTGASEERNQGVRIVRDIRGTDPEHVTTIDQADVDSLVGAVRRHVQGAGVDLVVSGPTAEQDVRSPFADPISEGLVEQLDRPLYIGGRDQKEEPVRRILVPSDRSEPSLDALQHAVRLADVFGAEVLLLHVVEQSPYVALTPTDRLSLSGPTLPEHRARRRLTAMMEMAHRTKVSVRPQLEFGTPVRQIVRVIDREDIDLVVLSSHGATAQSHRPVGSVALETLRRGAVPFFLVRTFGRSLLSDEASTQEDRR